MTEERNAQDPRPTRTRGDDLADELRELVERHGLSYSRAAEIMSQLENGAVAAHPEAGVKTAPPWRNGAAAQVALSRACLGSPSSTIFMPVNLGLHVR